jgi:hypothetical protein
MFQSKALKDFSESKKSKIYGWWIETRLADWYYGFTWKFIENPIFQVKRLAQWYWNVFRFDYDFDGHCLFAIIEYKLKRVQKCLVEGHAIQDPKDLKAIKLAIKLASRLKDDKYEERGYDRIDKKYGQSKHWFEPCNDGTGNSIWHSSRPKVNTDAEKEEEISFWRRQYELSDYRCKREERWLYAILLTYCRNWWD